MCKCCQLGFESCYWHLIEKHFCWDDSIALYEEPQTKQEKNNNMFDNWAFYDSVAIIAGRSIVTIDPIPAHSNKQPVVHQPTKRLRWWEDKAKTPEVKNREDIPIIDARSSVSTTSSDESTKRREDYITKIVDSHFSSETDAPKKEARSPSITKLTRSQTLAVIDDENTKMRKKLRERRMSRSQTFIFNNNIELPLIRQLSMPKFYVDTPDETQKESSIGLNPSTALMSPFIERNEFNFDLRSVVQLEKDKEKEATSKSVPMHNGEPEKSKRLAALRGKLNPLKIKRQLSVNEVPGPSYM